MKQNTLAIDIGGTSVKIGIVDEDYTIRKRLSIPTLLLNSTPDFYNYICSALPDLSNIARIGVSSPGLIDKNGLVRTHGAPKLADIFLSNIPDEISARTGKKVTAINDGRAAGLCELRLGNMRGCGSSVCYIIGTGIAGCICINDEILQGADNFAGEFHFISHLEKADEAPGRNGMECGIIGLVRIYSEITHSRPETIDGHTIVDLYRDGSPAAVQAFSFWMQRISTHIFSVIAVLNPEVVCVGGGITERDWFLPELREYIDRTVDRLFTEPKFLTTKIVECKYRGDSNLLGAALYAQNR